MKKNFLITSMIFLITSNIFSQDYHFTQYFANPLRLNPAIMGANSDLRVGLGYRSQWMNIQQGFTTMSFTGMYPVFIKNGGKLDIGISAISDKAGAFTTTDGALAVDYNKKVGKDQNLCLSLMGGYVQKSLTTSGLTFDNQYVLGSYNASNPSNEAILNNKTNYPDVGFGFVWYMNPSPDKSKLNAFLGISGFHLNQPNQSFTGTAAPLPLRMTYIGGIKIIGEKKIDISPNVRVIAQAGNIDLAAGLTVDYNLSDKMKLVIGAWYRQNDAIAFLIGIEHKSFTFGYSYDVVTSSITNMAAQTNANEITLSYKLHRGPKITVAMLDSDDSKKGDQDDSKKSNPFSSF